MTYRISRVQRVVFAVGKHLHQLEDLFVDVHDQAPQDVAACPPELDFLQLQKLDGGFVEVLVEGSPAPLVRSPSRSTAPPAARCHGHTQNAGHSSSRGARGGGALFNSASVL